MEEYYKIIIIVIYLCFDIYFYNCIYYYNFTVF